ncbi:hypothetical protein [Flavobacterium sp.]|uniref:hypothetical protein n=1 Tax=Flavobacterium sp. TaxID=239 RepID=UPI00286E9506|nr:hypothetical protein [Flavobacterium sp.]
MKKIYIKLVLILLFSQGIKAQTTSNCEFVYKLETIASPDETSNADKFVTLNWDFTQVGSKNKNIKIEIIPILDCYKNENAKHYKETLFLTIDGKLNTIKGSKVFKHIEMMSKCFKYRTLITSNSCEKSSDWNYYSFIN